MYFYLTPRFIDNHVHYVMFYDRISGNTGMGASRATKVKAVSIIRGSKERRAGGCFFI